VPRRPADGVEYGDGVEVVAPVCNLAVLDRNHGDNAADLQQLWDAIPAGAAGGHEPCGQDRHRGLEKKSFRLAIDGDTIAEVARTTSQEISRYKGYAARPGRR
jgi:hypothetical protein